MISVIVPVYNVAKYLKKCVDSILSQSYKDYEVILVDDGSTDDSGHICDEYAKENANVFAIHKENGGLSDARNVGIERAQGEYMTYVDSDDWIHEDFLLNLYQLASQNNADMVVCGVNFYYEGSPVEVDENVPDIHVYNGLDALENMLLGKLPQHGDSACAILYRSSISKQFKFPYGKYYEDTFLTFKYYGSSTRVVSTSQRMYYYLQRQNSIMHRPFGQSFIDALDAADYLVEECSKFGDKINNAANILKFNIYSMVLCENPNLRKVSDTTYKRICTFLSSIKFKILFKYKTGKRMKLYALSLIFGGVKFYQFLRNKG